MLNPMMEKICVTVTKEHYKKLNKMRNEKGWSRSMLVREALQDFLDTYYADGIIR
jgi:metal-responsive CopG/Arc/MetJ family transcriptional regulator